MKRITLTVECLHRLPMLKKCLKRKLLQDDPGPGLPAAHVVQTSTHRPSHQEGARCRGHISLYPARSVVHQREEDGRLCGVCR